MSQCDERAEAISYGMSGRLVTPDSPLPDLLDGFPEASAEGVVNE